MTLSQFWIKDIQDEIPPFSPILSADPDTGSGFVVLTRLSLRTALL